MQRILSTPSFEAGGVNVSKSVLHSFYFVAPEQTSM